MAHIDTAAGPPIRRITLEQPWSWLAAGWRDMWQAPHISLSYGGAFTVISLALTVGLFATGFEYLLPPLAAGFMFLGPLLAVGLYETSRRLQAGEPVSLRHALFVTTRAPAQLAFVGILLALFLLAWMRIATLLFALFIGTQAMPPLAEILPWLFFTRDGLGLLIVGGAVGAVLAVTAFAISVVSVPMLMVRDIDAVTAMILSVRTARRNAVVLALWAWLIAILTGVGLATLFIGLTLIFPLVGHASWHAYRDLSGE